MKLVYASRTGNVEKFVGKLGITDAVKITTGDEEVDEDFILICYNDGEGEIPDIVRKFLDNNAFLCQGVFTSGNIVRHPYTYNLAAEKINEEYDLPILGKFDTEGDEDDVDMVLEAFGK